jgi:XTP/dITP diphosphohydrolase
LRFVLATRNAHKLREFARLLAEHDLDPLPADVELPPETGETFAENALAKARAAARATGHPALGDDSGIEADALGGAPGVRSARFAGAGASDEANLRKLMAEAPAGSAVRYVCVLAHVDLESGREVLFEGRCEGTLASVARGDEGFGYDPVFIPAGDPRARTMAELSAAEKDALSHRGEAARAFLRWLGG